MLKVKHRLIHCTVAVMQLGRHVKIQYIHLIQDRLVCRQT